MDFGVTMPHFEGELLDAVGCLFAVIMLLLLSSILLTLLVAISASFWRAGGPLAGIGMFLLLLGIAYVYGAPIKKRQ